MFTSGGFRKGDLRGSFYGVLCVYRAGVCVCTTTLTHINWCLLTSCVFVTVFT